MTVRVSWLYPSPGTAGGQSREDTRLSPIGTMWPTGTMTTRAGLIPGGNPMALSGSGMTATIGLGRAVVQGTSTQGAYAAAVTAPHAVTLDPGHASLARIDVIALRVYDHVYDAGGQYIGNIVIVKGTEAGSPTVPAMPSPTTMPLYQITVPAGASAGTGGLAWGGATDLRAYTVAVGGILPVDASAAAGAYVGQVRIVADRLCQWNGGAWVEFAMPSAVSAALGAIPLGAWTPYAMAWESLTGTPSLGNGSREAHYTKTGRTYTVRIAQKWGTTTSSGPGIGPWFFTLPVAPAASAWSESGYVGSALAVVGGIRSMTCYMQPTGTSGKLVLVDAAGGQSGPTTPATWTTNNWFIAQLTYQGAS
ncbi:hypothetical protein [Streptomyces sp. SID3343]|uniref:hypothetical protein n=1 Tax=Streptomyces sp. SID3343 TaxID=2690260 RepID=UPI00136D08C3|nr:hypothetical protein [Streptomyces sp. SID3343]MYW03457.1 hypothetical protein [Streptomyces sp. SID3343]